MIPVLFKEDEQIFTHNGIGALYESLSCDVIEEENGAFTMELEYPVDGELFSEIKDFRIIQAKPNDIDDPHNFRIYEIEKSIDDLTVYVRANTRTNDLGNNLITDYKGKNVTPQQAMNGIKSNLIESTNFDFISDIQTTSNVEWTRINPLNAIVGTRGSLVDVWGGQIKRTNNTIYLYSRRGRDNVVTIRPGKNIEDLNMTVSTAGLVTKILPTFSYRPVDVPKYQIVELSDGTKEKRRVQASGSTTLRDDITILGNVVSSQHVDNYPTNYWSSVDYGDDDELKNIVDDYIDTRLTHAEEASEIVDMSGFDQELEDFVKTELDKRAKQYFTHRNPGVDKPTVRITVDMLQLSDSPDWEEFKDLERIGLTDTLDVWVEEYDIDVEVRVTSLTYDSIAEQVTNFNAGSDKAPRQSAIEKKYDDLTQATNDYITSFKNGIQNIMINTADGLNRKFEGYTEPPAELSSEGDIWFKQIGEGKVEIWIHDGVYWQPLMTEDFVEQLVMDIAVTQEELDEAKLQAIADSEQALADAKAHAEAEDARIRGELESDVGGAIELAEQAKADAVSKANQALADAKAHAEAEDARITQEIGLEVDGAIEIAEQAKQDAVSKANQALTDAKAHADAEIALIGTHFDGIIEGVESDVADAKQTADDAIYKIDNDITNKFASLDAEVLSIESISNTAQANAQTALTQSQDALGDASTALTNAQTALSQSQDALGDASTALTNSQTAIGSASNAATLAGDALTKANDARDTATILSGQVSGFESTVAGFNQTVNNYEGQVSGFRNDILGLESTVANYATEVDEFGNTVSTYATEVSTMRNTVSGFESTVATYGTEVSGLTGEVVGYKNQVSTLNNTVDGFNSVVTQVQYDLDNLEIGGRNLIPAFTSTRWDISHPVSIEGDYVISQPGTNNISVDIDVETNTVYTYTFNSDYARSAIAGYIDGVLNEQIFGLITGSFVRTFNSGDNNQLRINISKYSRETRTATTHNLKLEKGNKATDWTPAPEDMATTTQVSELSNTIDGFQSIVTKVEKDYAGISGTVASHTSSISNLNGEIALKANTTTVNTLTGRVTTAETGINANANAIKLKASQSSVDSLTGRVNTAETSITANANAIKLKANQTTVDTLSGTVNSLGADVGVVAGQISSKVWNTDIQTAVDGIEVGGRNLISNSKYFKDTNGWGGYTGITNTRLEDGMIKVDANASNSRAYIGGLIPKENNQTYTVSFLYKTTSNNPNDMRVAGKYWRVTGGESGSIPTVIAIVEQVSEDTYRATSSLTLRESDFEEEFRFYVFPFRGGDTGIVTLSIIEAKIEKGNIATDWTPAPKDTTDLINHVETELTQKYDSITATVSSIDGRVSTNELDLDGLTTTVQSVRTDLTGTTTLLNTTKTTVDSHTSSISTLRTDVDGKATTAQFNTLSNTVDGSIQRIGNAEGRLTTVETNINGIQTTVASKASQTQVTQLANGLSSVVKDLDDLEIGGRNLLRDSGIEVSNGRYDIAGYDLTDGIKEGEEVTLTIWGSLAATKSSFRAYNSGGSVTLATLIGNGDGTYSSTFKWKTGSSTNTWVSIYAFTSAQTGISTINKIKLEKGNKATDWTPAPEDVQSQITQLSDNINLRVKEGDVLSQINIEAKQTLIQSNKLVLDASSVIFTGSAFIPSAQIESINAAKITAGTINTARLNTSAIVTAGLTANVIKSTHIETSTATVDKLFATDAMVNRLTAKAAFISSVKAVDISAARITSGTISAARLNASAIVTSGLSANVIKSTHIETNTATVNKIFATDAMVTTLTAKTAFINSIKAVNIDAARITSGTISAARLNANAIVTAGLTANVVKSTHISGDTALFDKLFSTSSATNRLSARTAWIKDGMFVNASISGARIQDATIASAKIASLDAAKLTTGSINAGSNSSWNLTTGLLQTTGDWAQLRIRDGSLGFHRKDNGRYLGGFEVEHFISTNITSLSFVTGNPADHNLRFIGTRIESTQRNLGQATSNIYVIPSGDGRLRTTSEDSAYWYGLSTSGVELQYGSEISENTAGILTVQGNSQLELRQGGGTYAMNINASRARIQRPVEVTGNLTINNNARIRFLGADGATARDDFYRGTNDWININASGVGRTKIHGNAEANIVGTSDIRLKTRVNDSEIDALNLISGIRFIEFDWDLSNERNAGQPKGRQYGLEAQSIEFLQVEDEFGYLSVDQNREVVLNSHAIQQLALRETNTNKVASQALQLGESNESEIDELREENKELRSRIEELESVM